MIFVSPPEKPRVDLQKHLYTPEDVYIYLQECGGYSQDDYPIHPREIVDCFHEDLCTGFSNRRDFRR